MHLLLLHAEANITIIPTNIPSFEVSNNFIFIKHYHSKQKKYIHFYFKSFFLIWVFLTPHNQLFQVLQMKTDLSCLAPTSSCMFLSGLN